MAGIIGFGLFFLYDINSIRWKNKILHLSFLAGCVILFAFTAGQFIQSAGGARKQPAFWVCLIIAAFFLFLLIYTLFFALPFDDTYIQVQGKGTVYDRGMYALCRHPGVLWFFLFYLFLGLALWPSPMFGMGLFYSALNFLYVVFQDTWTFPRTFEGYESYQKNVPFLIPNGKSIRTAYRTRKN